MSASGAAKRSPIATLLNALGFEGVSLRAFSGEPRVPMAGLVASDTFRWLRRWAVVGVVAVVAPITVIAAFSADMPDLHHVAVPVAVAIISLAWALELLGVGWPRLVLVVATVLPNVWLTLIGHVSTNYLWLLLLVPWVAFAGTVAESVATLALALLTVGLSLGLGVPWEACVAWSFGLVLTWFMGLVLRRQVVLVAALRELRGQAEQVAVLQERQRLARELHDSVTQSLYGISLYSEAAARALHEADNAAAQANVQEIGDTAREALGEMRLLLFELRPPLLQEHGLGAALRTRLHAVEARAGLVTEFEGEDAPRLAPDTEQELYRVAQEALNNVLKHAHAARVGVRLAVTRGHAVLELEDDGVGFEPERHVADGYGLRGMRERVERLRGTLRIDSSPGTGTRLRVEVPT